MFPFGNLKDDKNSDNVGVFNNPNNIPSIQSWHDYCYENIDYEKVLYFQHKLLAEILNSRYSYEAAKEFLFSCKGILAVNYFSLERSTYLAEYYKNMVEKLKKDEDAFLKEQVGWLGLDISIVEEAKSELDDLYRERLKNAIEEFLDGKTEIVLSKDENLKFKGKNRTLFLHFSKSEEARGQNEKNDRTITPEVFNECMRNAGLPYNMKKEGKSKFKILKL